MKEITQLGQKGGLKEDKEASLWLNELIEN